MDIYAAGFNAWNQLSFDAPADNITEPDDISTFTKVLGDEDHFGRPRAGLHYTLGKNEIGPRPTTPQTAITPVQRSLDRLLNNTLKLTLLLAVRGSARYHYAGTGVDAGDDEALQDVYETCVAGNGLTLTIRSAHASAETKDVNLEPNQQSLRTYPCFSDFKSESNSTLHPCKCRIQEVAAFDVGFLILYQDGTVATLGDPRYQDCLAREVTHDV